MRRTLTAARKMRVNPKVPYKGERWNGFLKDVKSEARTFKMALRSTAAQNEEVNREYQECWRHSFSAIANAQKRKPDPSRMVPRLSRSQTRASTRPKRPSTGLSFEYDTRVSNHNRWPVRNVTTATQRVLAPSKLRDYPGLEREKDIVCLLGCPARPQDLW